MGNLQLSFGRFPRRRTDRRGRSPHRMSNKVLAPLCTLLRVDQKMRVARKSAGKDLGKDSK